MQTEGQQLINNLRQAYALVKTKDMKEKERILNDQIGGTLNTKEAEELIKVEPVEGTPFALVTTENKTFIALGNCQVSEVAEQDEKYILEERIQNRDWDLVINVAYAIAGEILKGKVNLPQSQSMKELMEDHNTE